MSTPIVTTTNPRATFHRDIESCIDLALAFAPGEWTEERYCPACDDDSEHIVVDSDGTESAECTLCGFTHDWRASL